MVVPELPVEIVSQILNQLRDDQSTLRKCSRVSRSFRALCLPFLFHHLCIPNADAYRHAFRLLVLESPHVGRYVKQIALDSRGLQTMVLGTENIRWLDADKFLMFLNALPALEVLRCDMDFYTGMLASVLPNSSITTLHLSDIRRNSSLDFVNLLMEILKAGSQTIQSLTLQSIYVPDEIYYYASMARMLTAPGVLRALEDMTLIQCTNLPFFHYNVQMPNIKTLELIDTEWTFQDCIAHIHSEHDRYEYASGIKRLEVVLLATQGERLHVDFSKHFELGFQENLIYLHKNGLLEKFMITVESYQGVRKPHLEVFFFKLKALGILDVQGGSLPRSCSRPGRYVCPPESTYYGSGAPSKWTWDPGF
ncbi:hypothetical protein BDN71DRAFT_1429905 [Pleurotus eryngii]|uniref:F-box domain-containing protein n=1 Tax=Pleurotus eryngii TaxID=5323 RepID=A0A9P6A461_PLEER|nr:hypothetical protein BDN71DRAFT_1429905 [Pleurotus eryngii]